MKVEWKNGCSLYYFTTISQTHYHTRKSRVPYFKFILNKLHQILFVWATYRNCNQHEMTNYSFQLLAEVGEITEHNVAKRYRRETHADPVYLVYIQLLRQPHQVNYSTDQQWFARSTAWMQLRDFYASALRSSSRFDDVFLCQYTMINTHNLHANVYM
jgi:hypothetical protein